MLTFDDLRAHILRMKAEAAKQDNQNYEKMIVDEVAEVELQDNLEPEDEYEYEDNGAGPCSLSLSLVPLLLLPCFYTSS